MNMNGLRIRCGSAIIARTQRNLGGIYFRESARKTIRWVWNDVFDNRGRVSKPVSSKSLEHHLIVLAANSKVVLCRVVSQRARSAARHGTELHFAEAGLDGEIVRGDILVFNLNAERVGDCSSSRNLRSLEVQSVQITQYPARRMCRG